MQRAGITDTTCLFPADKLHELDPAIVAREFSAKRQEKSSEESRTPCSRCYIWTTLGGFWAQYANILSSKTAHIRCTEGGLALFRRP